MSKLGDERSLAITYMHQMLRELRTMAETQSCEMLAYLIEMAYVESGELLQKDDDSAVGDRDRNGTA